MRIFEKLEIKFITEQNIPAENLIVKITILANRKNNYGLDFLKTDSEGKIIILRTTIENKINETMNDFIMDYASNINDCKDWIIIETENITELNSRLKNIEEYYPESAKKLSELLKNCSNNSYTPIEIEQRIEDEIKITIQSY